MYRRATRGRFCCARLPAAGRSAEASVVVDERKLDAIVCVRVCVFVWPVCVSCRSHRARMGTMTKANVVKEGLRRRELKGGETDTEWKVEKS